MQSRAQIKGNHRSNHLPRNITLLPLTGVVTTRGERLYHADYFDVMRMSRFEPYKLCGEWVEKNNGKDLKMLWYFMELVAHNTDYMDYLQTG